MADYMMQFFAYGHLRVVVAMDRPRRKVLAPAANRATSPPTSARRSAA
jgi:hypothetical protein